MNDSESWVMAWRQTVGLPQSLPSGAVAAVALLCLFWFVVIPSGSLIRYLDRKLIADFQARIGPNRAGPSGFYQPLADMLKLLQKANYLEGDQSGWFWLMVHTMALYSTLAILPLGSAIVMIDTDMTAFLPFWAALVLALGTMLLGLNQKTVSGWFGGIRGAAQTLSGTLPALVSLLTAGLAAGGFRWSIFIKAQGAGPLQWLLFKDPFLFMCAFIFVMSGLVLFEVPPLDGGQSMNDLHGGVGASIYGNKLSLYRVGRFYGFFLWTAITVVIFMGGWTLPFGLNETLRLSERWTLLQLLELSMVLLKTFSVMLLTGWISALNPQARVDQVTDFALRVLSPAALLALIGESCFVAWRSLG